MLLLVEGEVGRTRESCCCLWLQLGGQSLRSPITWTDGLFLEGRVVGSLEGPLLELTRSLASYSRYEEH